MKPLFTSFLLILCFWSQAQLFDNQGHIQLVKAGVDHIYNQNPDSADYYIAKVARRLPKHPVVPMLKALKVLWVNIPIVTIDTVFSKFQNHLQETIRLARGLDGGQEEDPEAIFFEMIARGLLAEYYADDGQYMKAISEASKAYDLLKEGFDMVEEVPDFYMSSGVYNYFREKYPEKYPVYRPFMWFFRSGDMELGLEQIRLAGEKSVLSSVEAYVYLSYIYLRYEGKARTARKYLLKLNAQYPNNSYILAKLLETYAAGDEIARVQKEKIMELVQLDRPYYQLAGYSFLGLYEEKVNDDREAALTGYQKAIKAGMEIKGHGEYYRSLAFLGIGRIHHYRGNTEEAELHLKKALSLAETSEVKEEAENLLETL